MTDRERAIKYRKEARRYKRKYFELKRATERTGHWIVHPKGGIFTQLICDKCLLSAPYDRRTNYCPNCGARMEDNDGETI